MKKHKLFLFSVLVTFLLLCSCSSIGVSSEASMPNDIKDRFSLLFHEEYVKNCKIEIITFSQREHTLSKAYELMNSPPHNLQYEKTLLHGRRYSITANLSDAIYYGALKDNKPNGFGVICDASTGEYLYIGKFVKGQYDGYGISFNNTLTDAGAIEWAIQNGYISDLDQEDIIYYLEHSVSYEGEWSKGERAGKGNEYNLSENTNNPVLKGFWAGSFYPAISVGQFSNDEYDGDSRFYAYGRLLYEGESKGEEPNGKGTSYYKNGQTQYEGHWQNGLYHGEGTLYNENGDVLYSGKWSRGDYAS